LSFLDFLLSTFGLFYLHAWLHGSITEVKKTGAGGKWAPTDKSFSSSFMETTLVSWEYLFCRITSGKHILKKNEVEYKSKF
jgi:hypothetical protein